MAKKPAKHEGDDAPRKKQNAGHTVVWGVLILVILGLGGYGAANFSASVRAIGRVGNTDIPVVRYQRELYQTIGRIQQQTGLKIGMQEAQAFGLDRAALANVVNDVALENEADRMGVSVGDAEVKRQLLAIPDFTGVDGKFDNEMYRAILARSNQTVADFEGELRAGGSRMLLQRAVVAGLAAPEAEAEALYQWLAQRRSFVWAELSDKDLTTPVPDPTEDQLKAYYDAHPDTYTKPEARRITYAWITPEMLVDKIEVSDDELQKLYQSKIDEYQKPERRLVERLVFGTEEDAQAAMDKIVKGETDFETLVKERGLTLDDVNLDEVTKAELGAAGDAVFGLAEPGVVGPQPSELGPAIFRVNAILDAQDTPFEDVKDELKADYALEKARREIGDMAEKVNDILAGGATLEDLVKETDLELGTVDWTADVSDGIAGFSAFRTAAQKVSKDDYPEAQALDDGGLFALRLDDVIPPALQPYADVADKVKEDWTRTATEDALTALADELIPRIEGGEDPASFGIEVNRQDAVTRDATLADAPDGLVAKAFELQPGKAARIPGTPGTTTIALVSTTEVLPPDPENADLEAQRAQIAQGLSAGLQNDVLAAFTRTIAESTGIEINQQAVEAVNASVN